MNIDPEALEGSAEESPGAEGLSPEPGDEFVLTPQVVALTERALMYLEAGYAVHLAGPPGTGKTTLAFHIAARLGRPVTLICGDDELIGSDLVGRDAGYRKTKLVDNFIHSVLKTSEETQAYWVDNRLTKACQNGDTLIYDEFSRSPPEANNALLAVLAERLLSLPRRHGGDEGFVEVHPSFRAIFTSNPEEYAGVHKTQDALQDRMITIQLRHYDHDTEVQITVAKSGISRADATTIVDVVQDLRGMGVHYRPSIRSAIVIARILAHEKAQALPDDPIFRGVARDVLAEAPGARGGDTITPETVDEVIRMVCSRGRRDTTTAE